MEAHVLKTLLQIHLASDATATIHVPYILSILRPEHLAPSSHLPKWTNRIHSLLHSKEPGGRWAGLCLAQASAKLSRSLMIDCAQDWLSVTFGLLSKSDTLPVVKASIRLTYSIFSGATDVAEFQRQIPTPNVPKFAAALINLVERYADVELKILCLQTLSRLVPLYPTLLRPSSNALNILALKFLSGQYPSPTKPSLLEAASRLYCCLHLTGGKVGAASAWRKTLDDTLAFGWAAFHCLHSTFTPGAPQLADPAMSISLEKDRLHCAVHILCDLLSATTHRAVQVPLGPLSAFVVAMLNVSDADPAVSIVDSNARTLQLSLNAFVVQHGCELMQKLVTSLPQHVSPHLSQWLTCLAYILEEPQPIALRASVLRTIACILKDSPSFHAPLVINRLARAATPSLVILLDRESHANPSPTAAISTASSKKGKKRARGFEGDEAFRLTKSAVCPTAADAEAVLYALAVMKYLLRAAELAPTLRSIASRVLLSMHLALPRMSPTAISEDPSVYVKVLGAVQAVVLEIGAGSSSAMGKGLPLAMKAMLLDANDDAFRTLDLLLHPRLPPLVRPLPHVDALALFAGEESSEERRARLDMGIVSMSDAPVPASEPTAMDLDTQPEPAQPRPPLTASSATNDYSQNQPPRSKTPPSAPSVASMPPPVLPPYSGAGGQADVATPTVAPATTVPAPPTQRMDSQMEVVSMVLTEEEGDEEMPAIDMSSDSEGE
ncbi:rRNA processing/ribosome biogenesis-domain-containing protein [Schizophyllum amplum]|uniref:Pre-rRNA-processing protein RIX1 n=1 Tax=Schizophyllum amplum TaxID=97359 RepID=A0A550CTM1_9AGAR|nr:rRNA processing/ribosome biogenesis-domain-containing protein [Auriculariopsis ampla]